MTTEQINQQPQQAPELIPDDGLPPQSNQATEQGPSEIYSEPLGFDSPFFTEDEFFEGFKGAFGLAADITHLKSFEITETELNGAKATSKRIYLLCNKYPFLNFIIDRRSGWLGEAVLIGSFVYGKTDAVLTEKAGFGLKSLIKEKVGKWKKGGKSNKKKLFGLVSLGRREAEKPTEPENSPQKATA